MRVEEDGIYFFLAPSSLSAKGSASAVSFPGARPGAQPLVLRTTLRETNPQGLLNTLRLVARPPRSVLVYEPGWDQPRCWWLPESFKDVSFLTWGNSTVNDQGLWLANPLGYFPWHLLQTEPEPSQGDLQG